MATTTPTAPAAPAAPVAPGAPTEPGRQFDPPFVLPDSVELRESVVYARPDEQNLYVDLFLPRQRVAPAPGVVYVHGGGWRGGTRRQFWRHAAHLASLGRPGAAISYRFAPAYRFPAQLEDVQAAVRWMRARAGEFGIDPKRIGAVGGSAGGHLAALLGTTDAVVDGIPSRVQAVVACNGVFDLPTLMSERASGPRSGLLGDDPQLAVQASPLYHVAARAAPTLLLHGTADVTVPFEQSVIFQRRLREAGVRAELFPAEGAQHGYFNRPPHYQPALERMTAFLLDVLGGHAS